MDASIAYCLGKQRFARLLPDAMVLLFPFDLHVGPEYASAVFMAAYPGALLLALARLSTERQKVMTANGFRPIGLPGD
jgi:hypothetical protein